MLFAFVNIFNEIYKENQMKCFVCVIAISISCSFVFATDESALPGATIIELDKITPNVDALVDTTPTKLPAPETVQTESVHTAATMLKCNSKNAIYTVQLGAFKARERAFALYWQLSKKISPLQVTAPMPKDQLYRVRYGSYPNRKEAQAAAEKLRKKGIECFVMPLKTIEIIPLKKGE